MSKTSDPKGWGIAALVVGLAIALTGGAYAIHLKTFCDPRHPTCVKIGPAAPHGEAHGAATHGDASHAKDAHPAAPGDTAKHADDHGKSDSSKTATGKGKSGGH